MSRALFDDVHAMAKVSKSLVEMRDVRPSPDVAAIEQGTRQRPDGTVENYQRVEFRESS